MSPGWDNDQRELERVIGFTIYVVSKFLFSLVIVFMLYWLAFGRD